VRRSPGTVAAKSIRERILKPYHVFLHLLGPDGRIVAQSDGIPANWTRPTTGRLPGEYIVDPRVLTLPPDAMPGTHTLQTGLYLPGDGRLITPDVGNHQNHGI